jgi:amidophosphoribosyltransferase
MDDLDDHPRHHCGIVGAIAKGNDVASDLFYGLRVLQHRGQESAGLAVHNGQIQAKKGMGLVHEVFNEEDLERLKGPVGIGHIRYSTEGASALENAQPIVASSIAGDIALAHNGEVVNAPTGTAAEGVGLHYQHGLGGHRSSPRQ